MKFDSPAHPADPAKDFLEPASESKRLAEPVQSQRAIATLVGRVRRLFAMAAYGIPLARLPELRRPRPQLVDDQPDHEQEHALRRYVSSSS